MYTMYLIVECMNVDSVMLSQIEIGRCALTGNDDHNIFLLLFNGELQPDGALSPTGPSNAGIIGPCWLEDVRCFLSVNFQVIVH